MEPKPVIAFETILMEIIRQKNTLQYGGVTAEEMRAVYRSAQHTWDQLKALQAEAAELAAGEAE